MKKWEDEEGTWLVRVEWECKRELGRDDTPGIDTSPAPDC